MIKIVTGLRRSGKSTLFAQLRGLINELDKDALCVYVNKESLEFHKIQKAEDLYMYMKNVRENQPNSPMYLFIDEAQLTEEWEKAVNSFLADGWADIYISGFNFSILSSELSTLLSGRYVEFPINPLSYREYLMFTNESPGEESFYQFLERGGLPGLHHFEPDSEVLFQYLLPNDEVFSREFNPLLQINDNYLKYVVTMNRTPPGDYQGIHRLSIPDFLLKEDWG